MMQLCDLRRPIATYLNKKVTSDAVRNDNCSNDCKLLFFSWEPTAPAASTLVISLSHSNPFKSTHDCRGCNQDDGIVTEEGIATMSSNENQGNRIPFRWVHPHGPKDRHVQLAHRAPALREVARLA